MAFSSQLKIIEIIYLLLWSSPVPALSARICFARLWKKLIRGHWKCSRPICVDWTRPFYLWWFKQGEFNGSSWACDCWRQRKVQFANLITYFAKFTSGDAIVDVWFITRIDAYSQFIYYDFKLIVWISFVHLFIVAPFFFFFPYIYSFKKYHCNLSKTQNN